MKNKSSAARYDNNEIHCLLRQRNLPIFQCMLCKCLCNLIKFKRNAACINIHYSYLEGMTTMKNVVQVFHG